MQSKNMVLGAIVVLVWSISGLSQSWQTLPNAPVLSRHNDVFFLDANAGWIVSGRDQNNRDIGQIFNTRDGGASWQLQFARANTHFRSVGFVSEERGWAGNVGAGEFNATDTTVLYQTFDGGGNWLPMNDFTGPKPVGLCGMYVLNDSSVYAVGRVRGPAYFAKTTDRGKTWLSKDMNEVAAGLIDVFFFDPDTGMAVGLTNVNHNQSSGVVLFTHDGGETWVRRFVSTRTGEWCWKISSPARNAIFAAVQRNSQTPIVILKSLDGGRNWEEKVFSFSNYFVQGIGFVNELEGWIGGNSSFPSFETTDGGETWHEAGFGSRMNRVRFLGDTLGFAVGQSVYKFQRSKTRVADRDHETPQSYRLAQNYPNPFNPQTIIEYALPAPRRVTIAIHDLTGKTVRVLVDERQPAGTHLVKWEGVDQAGQQASSGAYLYSLRAGEFRVTRKMVLLR